MDLKEYQEGYFYLLTFEKNFRQFTQMKIVGTDLTLASIMIMSYLEVNGSSGQKELTITFNASSAGMAVSLTQLEQRGYISKIPDENDRRNNIISLSKEGKETLGQMMDAHTEALAAVDRDDFTSADFNQLKSLQNKLLNHLKIIAEVSAKKPGKE